MSEPLESDSEIELDNGKSQDTTPADSDEFSGKNMHKRSKKSQGSGSSSKKREVTKSAREPSKAMLQFLMTKYTLFDPTTRIMGVTYSGAHTNFSNYDSYTLFNTPTATDAALIPKGGVRLSDFHVAVILESGLFSKKQLNTH